nr:putative ribonuclease H-like domain-containing protein [Tanacetum cinerariifolium]
MEILLEPTSNKLMVGNIKMEEKYSDESKSYQVIKSRKGNPHQALKDKCVIDSGCSRHMTGNISYLFEFEDINGGYVAFGGNPKSGRITGKGKIRTGKLDFDDVYIVKEIKFNLFSVLLMCDKKNNVLFTDTECVVLFFDFKLLDENHVLLRVPRENNMYNVNLKNVVPSGDLTCLFTKATLDESNLWHRRLGHINFKTTNKLVKCNLVRGLPSKVFKNNHTCVACKKGKQHRASCKTKPLSSVSQPLQRLHMDLFVPTFVNGLNKKSYYLVVTDDYSRFSWVFFLATKDDTSKILKTFTGIENQINHKVKIIRSDNGTEVKNHVLNQFCGMKGIKREFSIARTPQQNGNGPTWLFDIDTLTQSMNYQPVATGNQPNHNAGIQENLAAGKVRKDNESAQQYVLLPLWSTGSKDSHNADTDAAFDVKENESEVHVSLISSDKPKKHDEKAKREAKGKSPVDFSTRVIDLSDEFEEFSDNNTNRVNAASAPVTAVGPNSTNITNSFNAVGSSNNAISPNFEIDDVGAEADFSNLETSITVSRILTTRFYKDHYVTQIIGNLSAAPQTRSMTRMVKEQGGLTQINDEDFHTCMFACFLSQEEPKGVHQTLKDPSLIEVMQEELLQFKMQKVSVPVDLPTGKRAIGSKWVLRNKKDERGIVIKNKARLVAQGHTQEEGIDYEEVFTQVARIEAIWLFLAYATFMGFMVYQMDVKSAFIYGTINEEVYVCQPLGFEDVDYPDKVYKVVKALYGLHQAPRAWYETLANYLLENGFQRGKINQNLFIKKQKGDILLVQVYVNDIIFGSTNKELCKAFEKLMKDKFQMSSIGELTFFLGLQVKQKYDGIFISQDKYVAKILRKFGLTDGKSASTPIDTEKPLLKEPDGLGKKNTYLIGVTVTVFNLVVTLDVVTVTLEVVGKKNTYLIGVTVTVFNLVVTLDFCGIKGIKREFSVARTPQRNKIAKRKNRTLIEAARTMLADSLLPIPFWAEAVNTSFYIQNRNTNADAAFDVKENKSEVHVSPSSSDKPKKHDEKDKIEAKGKNMPTLEDIIYSDDEEDVGSEVDFSNLETSIPVSPILTTRFHKDHPVTQIIGALSFAPQTRSMTRMVKEQDLPKGKRDIGSKWVFKNKKDERGIVIRNKARLVAQGHTQEEGIDYEEVFALVARIKAILLFLAYASFMGFMVYQMDVKSAFLYGTIEEEVYVCQPPGFKDPDYPDKVYKVVKALYGLHQAPRAWYATLANYLLENDFQRGKINLTLFIKKQKDDLSSHNTKYTSLTLTQKLFANMKRIGKGFSGVNTPLFDNMLVQRQVHDDVTKVEEDEDNKVSAAPTPHSPTLATTPPPPQQEPIPLPP